jgi:hypothetical protein
MTPTHHRATGARPRWPLRAVAILLGVSLGMAAVEIALRARGATPRRQLIVHTNEPPLLEPDAQLGWRPIPGRHVIASYSPGGPEVHMTILPDGTRTTGAGPDTRDTLLLVGCSFTQGWAVSDEETFAWRLQRRFPDLKVINSGVGGYGTYQALMVMERALAGPDPPRTVVYGLMEEHEPRNVAAVPWLLMVAALSRNGIVSVPYCGLDTSGRLVRHAPEAYPSWPLDRYSALVAALERRFIELVAGGRVPQQRAVTEQLLLEMRRVAEGRGSRFGVVLLHATSASKAHYAAFLQRHGIDFVDCAFPIDATTRVRGDAHPNGLMHERYADCIARKIEAAGWSERPARTTPDPPS